MKGQGVRHKEIYFSTDSNDNKKDKTINRKIIKQVIEYLSNVILSNF